MATFDSNNGKSLNERINDVMNSKATDRSKKRSLIKLGLRAHEIDFVFAAAKVKPGEFDFARLTFGVEVECYNVYRSDLISEASANGLTVRSESYNHHDNERYYKLVSDGSLSGENSQEVVSPILNGDKGLESLRTLCSALAAVGAMVNRSCGLHVHIGAANMSDAHYCRLVRNYQRIELAIDSFMAPSRRANNNGFCRSLQGIDFSRCTTKQDIAAALSFDRYHKVNAEAYRAHQTIEFRQHQGTVDYTKISMWVRFLARLVEYSYKHDCPTCTTIEEIPFIDSEMRQYYTARRAALN